VSQSSHNNESGEAAAFDVVHARILRFFPDLVDELKGNLEYLLRKVGIVPEQFARSGHTATYRQVANLLELAALELECPDVGMRLAKLQNGRDMFGPLGHVMQSSRTFGEALEYVSTHNYAHSLAARVWLKRLPPGQSVFVGHDILLDGIPVKSQALEQILLVGHLSAIAMTGGHARVRRVHFRHQAVSPLKTYLRYFGCEARFGQSEDGVVYFGDDLARPIIDPDSQAFDKMVAYIDKKFTRRRPPLHAQVRGVIMRLLGTADCSNEVVAAELNLHLRTLHRRLRAEGTKFQQIKDEVRRDIMLYYLQQTDLEFSQISQRLGFAEQSVMSRRCNHWFCASPTQVRQQRRISPGTG
jgi:AraC-like DNA-binding protein